MVPIVIPGVVAVFTTPSTEVAARSMAKRRQRDVAGWSQVLLPWVAAIALAGCASQGAPARLAAQGAAQRTIVIGATRLDPMSLTISPSEAIGFLSTAGDPLQLQFIEPKDQTGKITCRVTDPKQLERGEAPWATFHTSREGRLTAYVPPGRFPSSCWFAPGSYSYTVKEVDAEMRPLEEKLGQLGTIVVK